jgi:hypothetical protein
MTSVSNGTAGSESIFMIHGPELKSLAGREVKIETREAG